MDINKDDQRPVQCRGGEGSVFNEKEDEDDIYLMFRLRKIRTNLFWTDRPTDRRTDIVVHWEVTLPKNMKFSLKKKSSRIVLQMLTESEMFICFYFNVS